MAVKAVKKNPPPPVTRSRAPASGCTESPAETESPATDRCNPVARHTGCPEPVPVPVPAPVPVPVSKKQETKATPTSKQLGRTPPREDIDVIPPSIEAFEPDTDDPDVCDEHDYEQHDWGWQIPTL